MKKSPDSFGSSYHYWPISFRVPSGAFLKRLAASLSGRNYPPDIIQGQIYPAPHDWIPIPELTFGLQVFHRCRHCLTMRFDNQLYGNKYYFLKDGIYAKNQEPPCQCR